MKIAIIGASGFLGTKLMKLLSKCCEVKGTCLKTNDRELHQLDATDRTEVNSFLSEYRPDVVIDTVGVASVGICEKNPRLAEQINYMSAKNIAESSGLIGAVMVFMSSSYVFDGEKEKYSEEDQTNAINEYARTKIRAEKEVLKLFKGIVLRVDFMYGYNGWDKKNDILDKIAAEGIFELRNPLQKRQPVLIDDLKEIILFLVEQKQYGIFHVGGPECMSKQDIVVGLESIVKKESKIQIVKEDLNSSKRQKNSTLDISKIKNLRLKTHSFEEGLEIIKKQISNSNHRAL